MDSSGERGRVGISSDESDTPSAAWLRWSFPSGRMVVMKVPTDGLQRKLNGYLRRRKVTDLPGVTAVARIDRRTKRLTKRLRAGEIAIIDHVDVDRVSAEALVACDAAGVVNEIGRAHV